MSNRLINVGMRGLTLGIRFIFIFFLARYLDPVAVGYYGLFTAAIGYCLYIVGIDFYVYVTREILKAPADQRGRLLKAQGVLSGLLYLALFPIALAFLRNSGWPAGLIWWFFPILLLEYVNQELSRLLIVLSRQLAASIILLVRQGSWAVAVVVVMAFEPSSRELGFVMALWTCAGLAAAAIGVLVLLGTGIKGWRLPIDWPWVRKGIAVSAVFLIATLALRGVQTIDRYWLEALGGIEVVAAYVLFMGVASTLLALLDASVFAYTYPALIADSQRQEYGAARKKMRSMAIQTVLGCAAFGVVSWVLLPWLLEWTANPVYRNALPLYPWILMAMVLNALGLVPHYGLYAHGRDRPIIHSHIAALPAFALSVWFFSGAYKVLAVPIGLNVSFALILIWKTVAYWRVDKSLGPSSPSS